MWNGCEIPTGNAAAKRPWMTRKAGVEAQVRELAMESLAVGAVQVVDVAELKGRVQKQRRGLRAGFGGFGQ